MADNEMLAVNESTESYDDEAIMAAHREMKENEKKADFEKPFDENALLEVRHLRKCFPIKKSITGKTLQELIAVDDISFKLNPGETLGIVGESGCGKTTLLNIIGGLDHYTSGDLLIGGRSTKSYTDRDWDVYRNHRIGFIFQSYNLIPHQSVLQNVEIALTLSGVSKAERRKRAIKVLQDVGLGYIKLGQSSSTLSGGESQRVKLASFLTKDTGRGSIIFIFDEPTTGLHFHDIKRLLAAFNALIANGHTVVIVEHNMDIIKCADHIIDLGPEAGDIGGRVVFEGTPKDLLDCKSSYTGSYLKPHFK